MVEAFHVPVVPKPSDPSDYRSAFIVTVEDITVEEGIRYFFSVKRIDKQVSVLCFSGVEVNKKEVSKLEKDLNAKIKPGKEVSFDFPWQRVVNIQNFKQAKKSQ